MIFFSALILLACYNDAEESEESERMTLQAAADEEIQKLTRWQENCRENFEHKRLVAEAERLRVLGMESFAIGFPN